MRADIEYRVLVPAQRHFDCSSLRATLDTASCADRWKRATLPNMEKLITCRRCPVGRQHHAEHYPEQEDALPERAPVCIRCGKSAARLVGGETCLSCYNRKLEWIRGRNARGNAPRAYAPLIPRRVGIIAGDGRPAWALFEGQHQAEAMVRATRAGLRLSDEQPGRVTWNSGAGRFEYRDEAGRVLLALEIDGRIEYVAVDQLHPGEQPAPVTMPTILLSPEEAAEWLAISGEIHDLVGDQRQTDFACAKCRRAMLLARKQQGGTIQAWCSAGCGPE